MIDSANSSNERQISENKLAESEPLRARSAIALAPGPDGDDSPESDSASSGRRARINRSTLLAQAIATNALAVTGLIFFAVIVFGLNSGVESSRAELVVLMVAIASVLALNIALLRRQFAPLEQLVSTMDRIDLSEPGERAEIPAGATEDVAELVDTFNAMIERLADERREKIHASVQAQETERARVARDLHDEANQALTAVILRLEAASQSATPELAEEIAEAKGLATQAMEELLDVVRRLRPTTLDLGLRKALASQVSDFGDRSGIETHFSYFGDSGVRLGDERELAVYRIVQEALSNVVQHADATRVHVTLTVGDTVVLRVRDDGAGFDTSVPNKRFGVVGMRERAQLVDGKLEIKSEPGEGTEITMELT